MKLKLGHCLHRLLAAWYGIDEADNENSCRLSNTSQDCIPIISLLSPLNASESEALALPLTGRLLDFNYDLYLFWMAGATVCGLVWACINVVTLIFFNELIRTHLVLLAKVEKEAADG